MNERRFTTQSADISGALCNSFRIVPSSIQAIKKSCGEFGHDEMCPMSGLEIE